VGSNITLISTSLAVDDVFVLCHSSWISTGSTPPCDQLSGSVNFDGDDAVELVCDGTTYDVIGQIGFDPGTEWGTGLTSTADNTLRRKCALTDGDPDGSDAFDPSIEWDGFAVATYSGMGEHCP
jgi:hypothetical protein